MESKSFQDLNASNLTSHVIKVSTDKVASERYRVLITGLIQHLHGYVREVELKPHEWEDAIHYLTQAGQDSSPDRQEMILTSDVLGVSALVEAINSAKAKADSATESSVLGPFHSEDTNVLTNGQSIGSPGVMGELMLIHGTVKSADDEAIEGAAVDIWETNGNGLYDMQDSNRDGPNCRGIFYTDKQGRYYLIGVKSVDYDIPSDKSVGLLLGMMKRNITRPAHVHFQIQHHAHHSLTTALYSDQSQYISDDPVFGVKESLIKNFEWNSVPTSLINNYSLKPSLEQMKWNGKGLWVLHHDFVLLHK
ncbi:hypothetical protein H9Q72_001068 [Fusarium xylarioides]|uniref:Intradiol ring-cleavage dioxygenases domain-containing protein n=1 Tax=Fusarium xylarioides TaxID=221167 RepID=A0A9P7I3H2_9HYPO|nr:hypothetical protein H9Q72_001068 [Fusarium xylarioides]